VDAAPADTGEATGRGPSNLTLTIGFGASLFRHSLGLEQARPSGLVDIPAFPGDQLEANRSGGDLAVQICGDDPQVVFHALHTLARLGLGTVSLRCIQHGFGRTSVTSTSQKTERNLLGFKDGTNNLLSSDTSGMNRFVWVNDPRQPTWMQGGTYLVNRRIRTRLELWNETPLGIQQDVIGRFRSSGAPLSGHREHDRVDLAAQSSVGQPVIPTGAHIRVASPSANGGERILRRGYGFTDGVDPVTGELDAGLVFICFQRDPQRQFIAIQERLSASDTLHGYLIHTASGLYACPRGLRPGEGWGQMLNA
jgi:deferrochelatase/peroxidase EfeB